MNARALPAAFDLAAAVNCANATCEARLTERIRDLEAAVNRTQAGSDRHCANMRLCDAWAALDKFRKNASHPQGYFV